VIVSASAKEQTKMRNGFEIIETPTIVPSEAKPTKTVTAGAL
jgi:hypothetical protein